MPFVSKRSAGDGDGGVQLACQNLKLGPADSCFGRGLSGTFGWTKEAKESVSSSLSMALVRARREFVMNDLYPEEGVVGLANNR